LERLGKIIHALLSLKEIEHFGRAQAGDILSRQERLIDHLLQPLEHEWLGRQQAGAIIPRVKALRMKILPELIQGDLDAAQRKRRWKHLADLYLAQQVASYPPDYLTTPTTQTRVLETVERMEEDLTDVARIHRPWQAVIEIGPAIVASPERGTRGEEDPIMGSLREQLQNMLLKLATESATFEG
jgi:hypothetical protein